MKYILLLSLSLPILIYAHPIKQPDNFLNIGLFLKPREIRNLEKTLLMDSQSRKNVRRRHQDSVQHKEGYWIFPNQYTHLDNVESVRLDQAIQFPQLTPAVQENIKNVYRKHPISLNNPLTRLYIHYLFTIFRNTFEWGLTEQAYSHITIPLHIWAIWDSLRINMLSIRSQSQDPIIREEIHQFVNDIYCISDLAIQWTAKANSKIKDTDQLNEARWAWLSRTRRDISERFVSSQLQPPSFHLHQSEEEVRVYIHKYFETLIETIVQEKQLFNFMDSVILRKINAAPLYMRPILRSNAFDEFWLELEEKPKALQEFTKTVHDIVMHRPTQKTQVIEVLLNWYSSLL